MTKRIKRFLVVYESEVERDVKFSGFFHYLSQIKKFISSSNVLPEAHLLLRILADGLQKARFLSAKTIQELFRRANIELEFLYRWIIYNKLSLNSTKLYYLLFNAKLDNILPLLRIGDVEIPRSTHVKFLGLILDDKLKWDLHIDALCKKLSKLNGVLYLVRNSLSATALKCIYFSLVYSHLIYGICIWGGTYRTHLDAIIKAQKRVLRSISFERRDAPSLPLFNRLHMLSFDNIYNIFYLCINI